MVSHLTKVSFEASITRAMLLIRIFSVSDRGGCKNTRVLVQMQIPRTELQEMRRS